MLVHRNIALIWNWANMMQWSCHWSGSFIINNTGGRQGELHSGGDDRQQIRNKHLVYLFNVFFMFLELLRTALNININFSYISIYAPHLGTYWKLRLYFSVVLPPFSASKPNAVFLTSKKPVEWNLGEPSLKVVIIVLAIRWPLQKGWGCHSEATCWLNAKPAMPCHNL